MKATKPKPPASLSLPARNLWQSIVDEYGIADVGGLTVLSAGIEAYERMREAQAVVGREGLTIQDRYGVAKAHPACAVERDCRGQWLAALKMLNLDVEPVASRIGRPAGTPSKLRAV